MLIGIRRGPLPPSGPPGAEEIVLLLLACHDRIRSFLALGVRLAASEPEALVSDAAVALGRYFGLALPLHSLDEDASIAPRLLATEPSVELRSALEDGAHEHGEMEAHIAALLPMWSDVARDPAMLPAHRSAIAAEAARLERLFPDHLAREEAIVFPAIARLPEAIRAAILAEMRARRGPAEATRP